MLNFHIKEWFCLKGMRKPIISICLHIINFMRLNSLAAAQDDMQSVMLMDESVMYLSLLCFSLSHRDECMHTKIITHNTRMLLLFKVLKDFEGKCTTL